ncbi:Uncharacterised protein [Arcanobacterium haemolyticum]|nr:Uncharacterised protein [Arcanobacterium haemolyticum]
MLLATKTRFLISREQGFYDGLFPPDDPRIKRVLHKFEALLLNIAKARFFQVANHVGRDTKYSGDLIELKLPCL